MLNITTAQQFISAVTAYANSEAIEGLADTESAIEEFADWMHDESEAWLDFEEWETLCMSLGLA